MKLFFVTLPFLIGYFLFCYLPLSGWLYALFDYKLGFRLFDCEFVGLENFTVMFNNSVKLREMKRVMANTVAMGMLSLLSSFLPMLFAVFLNEIPFKKFRKAVQTLTTIPNFVSWVLIYAFMFSLFSVDNGVINIILKQLGIIESGINILASGKHVWLTMWGYSTWKGLGWSAIIYLSGLNSIDQELYEAANVDGAGRFQKIRYITIPGLMPTFVTLLIMHIGNFLHTGMDMYYVFENAFNHDKIEVLDLYVYNVGIGNGNISYSTAIGMAKSLIAIMLLFIANTISGKIREEKVF